MFPLIFVVVVSLSGCKVTAGLYVEKDWQTDWQMKNPDLRTKLKLEAERNFTNWDEVFLMHTGEEDAHDHDG
jgi:hypothetical protein